MTFRLCLFFAAVIFSTHVLGVFVSNLNDACLRCLCQAVTGCNLTTCAKGYCGPFYIARIYWADADKPVLLDDDPMREGAYQDCALQYNCAKRIVERYMAKYGRDCNNDGVTGCEDYVMIHYNGASSCEKSLEGTGFYNRFVQCRQVQSSADKLS